METSINIGIVILNFLFDSTLGLCGWRVCALLRPVARSYISFTDPAATDSSGLVYRLMYLPERCPMLRSSSYALTVVDWARWKANVWRRSCGRKCSRGGSNRSPCLGTGLSLPHAPSPEPHLSAAAVTAGTPSPAPPPASQPPSGPPSPPERSGRPWASAPRPLRPS